MCIVAWEEGRVECILKTIEVHSPSDRGKGWGTKMLHAMRGWLFERGCRRMIWDDLSQRYRKPHNVYLSIGATYDADDGPEMTWDWSSYEEEKKEDEETMKKNCSLIVIRM